MSNRYWIIQASEIHMFWFDFESFNETFGRKIKVSNYGIVPNKLWNESMQTSKTRPLMIQKSYFIAFLVIFLFSRSNLPKCFWKNHHSTILSKKTTIFCDFQKSFKYFFDVWVKDFLTKMRQFEILKISVCYVNW